MWPRRAEAGETRFDLYLPQIDSWDGLVLKAHAPVAAVTASGPVLGVASFTARTLVDRRARLVELEALDVKDAAFPSAPSQAPAWLAALRTAAPPALATVPLEYLEAQWVPLAKGAATLRNDPPKILFSPKPALLVYIDGPPRYAPVPGTKLARVLNTRALILRDAEGMHFLRLFDGYVASRSLNGPWLPAQSRPADATVAEAWAREVGTVDFLEGGIEPATGRRPVLAQRSLPQIVLANTPTELIATAGKPSFVPLSGTTLGYAENTAAQLFRTSDETFYVLLGGRWYRAAALAGPWSHVGAKDLPRDFAAIPDGSIKENVKASVPGTRQAQEAYAANQVPAIAKIARRTGKLGIAVDGAPELRAIDGTSLSYVVNASVPVILVEGRSFYACVSGVWFVASALAGPWTVADSVPASIYAIPPSSPLHYVTYVRVYGSANEFVYAGYTPGYLGSMTSSDGTVVYGAGYGYESWARNAWFSAPLTWGTGAAMAWTPWTGWAFGFGGGFAWGYPWRAVAPWWGAFGGSAVHADGMPVSGPGGWASTASDLYRTRVSAVPGSARAAVSSAERVAWAARYGEAYNSTTGALVAGASGATRTVFEAGNVRAAERESDTIVAGDALFAARDGIVFLRDRVTARWRQADRAGAGAEPPAQANWFATREALAALRVQAWREIESPSGADRAATVTQ